MTEQKLRRQYVKSITKESPELHEFSSWTSPPLSQETVEFASFSCRMDLIDYTLREFTKDHLYFGPNKKFSNNRKQYTYYPKVSEEEMSLMINDITVKTIRQICKDANFKVSLFNGPNEYERNSFITGDSLVIDLTYCILSFFSVI